MCRQNIYFHGALRSIPFNLICNMTTFRIKKCVTIMTNAPKDEDISRTEARCQGHSDSKTVCDTLQPKDVLSHLIWDSYLK